MNIDYVETRFNYVPNVRVLPIQQQVNEQLIKEQLHTEYTISMLFCQNS